MRALAGVLAIVGSVITATAAGATPISVTGLGATYSQDFNTLSTTGTANTALPLGWGFLETDTNANTTYRSGTGSDNTGDTYSFGAAGSIERALGTLLSNTLNPAIGVSFTNNTGGVITSLQIAYTGEQWRLGAAGREDRLDFEYSLDATSLTSGTFSAIDALDFLAPITAGSIGALNGNSAANRTSITSTITGLSIASGDTFWLRWSDYNAANSDDGLAIDDFSLTATGSVQVPEPGAFLLFASALIGFGRLRRRHRTAMAALRL